MSDEKNFLFEVDRCQSNEIAQCKIGDYVNLWVPKDGSKKVHIFRRGSVGGTGWLGYVPDKYSRVLAIHLTDGLKCETEIQEININKSRCVIKCKMISREEQQASQAVANQTASLELKKELLAKYKPRNPLIISKIQLPKNHKLTEGQELLIENQPLEFYLQNAMKLYVNFIDVDGTVVARKSYELKIIRTILRAYFNKIPLKIRIKTIDKPSESTLKYLEFIEATVEVIFG
jgi:hypothetical protein